MEEVKGSSLGAFFMRENGRRRKMKMKKILAAVMAGVLCMALIGRGEILGIGTKRQKKTEDQKGGTRGKKIWDES